MVLNLAFRGRIELKVNYNDYSWKYVLKDTKRTKCCVCLVFGEGEELVI